MISTALVALALVWASPGIPDSPEAIPVQAGDTVPSDGVFLPHDLARRVRDALSDMDTDRQILRMQLDWCEDAARFTTPLRSSLLDTTPRPGWYVEWWVVPAAVAAGVVVGAVVW